MVTYRRRSKLAATLGALAEQPDAIGEVIVVDNDADPQVRQVVEDLGGALPTRYLPAAENLGPAGGTALAIDDALARRPPVDWLMRIDDDRWPHPEGVFDDLLAFALRMREQDPRTGGVGLVGSRWDRRTARLHKVDATGDRDAVPVDFLATNHYATFSLAALRETGGMDASLFFGMSEVDLGLRLRAHGRTLWLHGARVRQRRVATDGAAVRHRPSWRVRDVDWRDYYSLRNSIVVARRYGSPGAALRTTLVRGVGKPLVNLLMARRSSLPYATLAARAVVDAWAGRMGRRVDPYAWERRRGRLDDQREMRAT